VGFYQLVLQAAAQVLSGHTAIMRLSRSIDRPSSSLRLRLFRVALSGPGHGLERLCMFGFLLLSYAQLRQDCPKRFSRV